MADDLLTAQEAADFLKVKKTGKTFTLQSVAE